MRSLDTIRRRSPPVFATLVGVSLGAVALAALLTTTETSTQRARFAVNLFKFAVGVYCIVISFYFYYGPQLHARGVAQRLVPASTFPLEIVILYFALGAGAVFTSLAILRPGLELVLFWRMVGFSVLLATATGYLVLLLERSRTGRFAPDGSGGGGP